MTGHNFSAESEPSRFHPLVITRNPVPRGERLELAVPPDSAWFRGHFPGRPILPGVAELGWAIAGAQLVFGYHHDPRHIECLRFRQPVIPGERLTLLLQADPHCAERIKFQYHRSGENISGGTLCFDS